MAKTERTMTEVEEREWKMWLAASHPPTTAERLRAMVAEQPNLCETKTLVEIGAELGVTGERVRQLLPSPPTARNQIRAQNLQAEHSRLLAQYVESHPLALMGRGFGGPSMKEIAVELGISYARLSLIWRLCGYPSKDSVSRHRLLTPAEEARYIYQNLPGHKERQLFFTRRWQAAHPEKKREMDRRAGAKYKAKMKALSKAV